MKNPSNIGSFELKSSIFFLNPMMIISFIAITILMFNPEYIQFILKGENNIRYLKKIFLIKLFLRPEFPFN